MNEPARRLRAQKAYSTDPEYLEGMARDEEIRGPVPTAEIAAGLQGGGGPLPSSNGILASLSNRLRRRRPKAHITIARKTAIKITSQIK